MKKLVLIAALGLAGLASVPAHALTTTANFDVTVNLFPKCEITTAPGNLSVNYDSFQVGAAATTTDFSVRCTNTLPYAMSLSSSSGTLVGLSYTLAIRNSADTAVASSGTGAGTTPADYKVKLSVAGGQSGTCATVQTSGASACSATDSARTLTITY